MNEEFTPTLKIEENETTPPSHLSEADLIKTTTHKAKRKEELAKILNNK